jgi:hypothetical protein
VTCTLAALEAMGCNKMRPSFRTACATLSRPRCRCECEAGKALGNHDQDTSEQKEAIQRTGKTDCVRVAAVTGEQAL